MHFFVLKRIFWEFCIGHLRHSLFWWEMLIRYFHDWSSWTFCVWTHSQKSLLSFWVDFQFHSFWYCGINWVSCVCWLCSFSIAAILHFCIYNFRIRFCSVQEFREWSDFFRSFRPVERYFFLSILPLTWKNGADNRPHRDLALRTLCTPFIGIWGSWNKGNFTVRFELGFIVSFLVRGFWTFQGGRVGARGGVEEGWFWGDERSWIIFCNRRRKWEWKKDIGIGINHCYVWGGGWGTFPWFERGTSEWC